MAKKTKKKGPTPPRQVRQEARGRPGQIRPTNERARAKRKANLITGGVILVLVAAAVVAGILTVRGGGDQVALSTSLAPWPPNTDDLPELMTRADVPTPGTERFHRHVHLDVFVDGVPTPIPNGMGITAGLFAGIHTHDASGVIHVEANESFNATIGDIFTIWGVRLSPRCVGGYCEPDETIAVYVNGDAVEDFVDYAVEEHDEIAVVVGQPPEEIPESYDFSDNPTIPTPTPSAVSPGPTTSGPPESPGATPS